MSGEVRNLKILVYDVDKEKTLETLRHELVDYLVSCVAEPYKKISNLLIGVVNEDAYMCKERVVKFLTRLFSEK